MQLSTFVKRPWIWATPAFIFFVARLIPIISLMLKPNPPELRKPADSPKVDKILRAMGGDEDSQRRRELDELLRKIDADDDSQRWRELDELLKEMDADDDSQRRREAKRPKVWGSDIEEVLQRNESVTAPVSPDSE